MIVVVGSPLGWLRNDKIVPTGTPAGAAMAAATAGAQVQLIGRTGDDPTADGLLLALSQGGVGHVAVLRDPARSTPLVPEPPRDDLASELPGDETRRHHSEPRCRRSMPGTSTWACAT